MNSIYGNLKEETNSTWKAQNYNRATIVPRLNHPCFKSLALRDRYTEITLERKRNET